MEDIDINKKKKYISVVLEGDLYDKFIEIREEFKYNLGHSTDISVIRALIVEKFRQIEK